MIYLKKEKSNFMVMNLINSIYILFKNIAIIAIKVVNFVQFFNSLSKIYEKSFNNKNI